MNFKDEIIEKTDLNTADDIYKIIVSYLCGERYYKQLLKKEEKDLVSKVIKKMKKEGLNYAQFNELLLLLGQDRVNEAFFKFFFEKDIIELIDLKMGITKFRGFAMLCFGNFRFAYKELMQKSEDEIKDSLKPYCDLIEKSKEKFEQRPSKALDVEKIRRSEAWYNGYISKQKFYKESKILRDLLEGKTTLFTNYSEEMLLQIADIYSKAGARIKDVEQRALKNTNIYLSWDYMDVYIATSMRHKWEFEETFDFVNEVFGDEKLKDLNLRFFDPTQSQCEDRIDKGLIEGLMLKRALCTIYMAQETDTMGKDSELAATLSQRKPVIAYVPSIEVESHSKRIMKYPLDYIKTRFLILQADGIFEDESCMKELKNHDIEYLSTFDNYFKEYEEYRFSQPFTMVEKEENNFKRKSRYYSGVCELLALAEYFSFERRARTLIEIHPLSIQVHLESGVANGVLVVRSAKDCAELLYRVLTNSLEFNLKHTGKAKKGVTILEERISGCPFRVVTDNERLTNSFWNFYLRKE